MARQAEVTERPEESPEEPALLGSLWRTMQSVRATIYILPAIAVAATIGSLIPQGRPVDYYLMLYGPRKGWLVLQLGLDSMYGSTWFLLLIGLLLANLAACAGKSFRRAALEYRGPSAEALARKLEGARSASCWFGEAGTPDVEQPLTEAARRRLNQVRAEDGPGGRRVLIRCWSWAAYGRIVTHLAVFLVAVGAVLGVLPWTSIDEDVTAAEGETWKDTQGKLGFDVRLDKFHMDYYPETGMPSHYASDLTLLSGGSETGKGTATVNKSLVHSGVALGQSSWALAGVRVIVTGPRGAEEPLVFGLASSSNGWTPDEEGRVAFLGDRKWALVANQFAADAVERGGEIVGSMSEYPRNPAVLLQAVSGLDVGKHEFHDLGWLRKGKTLSFGGHAVRLDDVVYNSTLSARKDLGLPLVWAGFILMTLGMVVMFYVRPRTLLVAIGPAAKGEAAPIAVAPSGRELLESDRLLIEGACRAELTQGRGLK